LQIVASQAIRSLQNGHFLVVDNSTNLVTSFITSMMAQKPPTKNTMTSHIER